jgi:hypothetical protein
MYDPDLNIRAPLHNSFNIINKHQHHQPSSVEAQSTNVCYQKQNV